MNYAHPRRGLNGFIHSNSRSRRFALNRALLPSPIDYYVNMSGLFLQGGGEWCSTICPFHADTRPSLRINVVKGCFKCMSCEAKGSDIIAFHMQRHELSFIDACKALGAWEAQR